MKRLCKSAAAIVMVALWILPATVMAQEGGQCYFQASEDVYLQIYHIGSEGVERRIIWQGHLAEGETKAYNSPDGQVGYGTTDSLENPWDETEAECIDGEAIDIP